MFKHFTKAAKKERKLLSRQTGFEGCLADIEEATSLNTHFKKKITLSQGAVDALFAGRPENFRAFAKGYIAFKNKAGHLDGMSDDIGHGMRVLLVDPLLSILNAKEDPVATLAFLCEGLPPYHKQIFLDFSLRVAASNDNTFAAKALLEAGADANTCSGRPLLNALRNGHPNTAKILIEAGADPDITRLLVVDTRGYADFKRTLFVVMAMIDKEPSSEKTTDNLPPQKIINKKLSPPPPPRA